MRPFRDSEHLFRMALVFVFGISAFAVARAYLVPKSFGQYGHYRGDAIGEVANHPVKFAGHQACEDCHADQIAKKNSSRHKTVNCEACHGPVAQHVDDPSTTPKKLDSALLCVTCHEKIASKPKAFPQVASQEHSDGIACDTCHEPHSPKVEAAAKAKQEK